MPQSRRDRTPGKPHLPATVSSSSTTTPTQATPTVAVVDAPPQRSPDKSKSLSLQTRSEGPNTTNVDQHLGCGSRVLSKEVASAVRRTHALFQRVSASRTLKYKSNEVLVANGSRFVHCGPRSGHARQRLPSLDGNAMTHSLTACRFEFPIRIEQSGARVKWRFQVKGGDIAFSVAFVSHGGAPIVPSKTQQRRERTLDSSHPSSQAGSRHTCSDLGRVGANGDVVEGGVDVPPSAAQLFLVWDNSFSWWTPKTLKYSVHLQYTSRSSRTDSNATSSANSSESAPPPNNAFNERDEMLVTLCNVMRQLNDNKQKILEYGRRYQAEHSAAADLKVRSCKLRLVATMSVFCRFTQPTDRPHTSTGKEGGTRNCTHTPEGSRA